MAAALVSPSPSLLLFLFLTNLGAYSGSTIRIINNCKFIAWPVISGNGSPPTFAMVLQTGESQEFNPPSSWTGYVWGRTNCSDSDDGKFICMTGGCRNNSQDCAVTDATIFTRVEFGLSVNSDFYDVSLVDGFNFPVLVSPQGNNCSETGCVADLNSVCPQELHLNRDGKLVGCRGPCSVFRAPEYCCASPRSCGPTQYSRVFKNACPKAYSYPKDDATSTFRCRAGADYNVTFCPSANAASGLPASPATPPSSHGSPPSSKGSRSSSQGMGKHMKISLIVASTGVLLIVGLVFLITRKIKQGKREKNIRELLTLDGHTKPLGSKSRGTKNHDLILFPYEYVLSATNKFSLENKLGAGGFGSIYKGRTSDGQDIAVKVLSRQSGQGMLEFKTELVLISKLQHVNLVKLHGFCIHGEDKMIIYDYMPNKSLDFFLFGPPMGQQLNWNQRFNIIEGIAQGLLYLHKYSRLMIVHRDLKPSNILLDENMNAKISDFGLAKVFERNIDEANTNRRVGTFGYMAPEYAMQGIYSVRTDVYSFGVLVLEIVSGRKNNCFNQIEGPLNLVEYAWELWRNNSPLQLMDPTLSESCVVEQLTRCIHIGLLCVEDRAINRPTIEDVMSMLKSETNLLMPKNPAFIARNHVMLQKVNANADSSKSSVNEITLSEVGAR